MMDMDAREAEILRHECRTFCRALMGMDATPYVVGKYVCGHAAHPFLRQHEPRAFDAVLVRAARRGGFSLRCADTYARFFQPAGVLRKKLILLLAVAENAPSLHDWLNEARQQSLLRSLLGMATMLVLSAGVLVVAVARFAPLHLAARVARARRPHNEQQESVRATVNRPATVIPHAVHGKVDR